MDTLLHCISRKISFLLIGSLAFSSVGTTFSQEFLRKTKKAVSSAMKDITSSATQRIKSGLSGAFTKIRGLDRTLIIDQLEKQVRNLGNNVGYMANCIASGSCSSTERAAFIGTSLLVLALTAATIGATLTVAATSKEVDSVVAATSQEVTGWSSQDILTRLTNTINNFKNSLASLKEGMIRRELTAGQKKFLYGAALSIAALVTIVMGISITSYMYAQKQEKKEKEELAQQQLAEQRRKVELEARAQQLSEEEIQALLAEIGGPTFDDNPLTPQELQKQSIFNRYFLSHIDVIKGGPQRLKEGFDKVKEQIKQGLIKTKDGAILAYETAVDFKQHLPSILENALGVSIEKMNTGYNAVKKALDDFKDALANPKQFLAAVGWDPSQPSFFSSLKELVTYLGSLATMKENAKQALVQLNLLKIIHAKSLTPQEYQSKKNKLAERKKELEKTKAALVQQAQQSLSDEQRKKLIKKEQEFARAWNKLGEEERILTAKEQFDLFISPNYWANQYYPGLIQKINGLQLRTAGQVVEVIFSKLGGIFKAAEFLNAHGGKIGKRLFPNTAQIGAGLNRLKEELPKLGTNLKELLSVQPLILIPSITQGEIVATALNALVKKERAFFKENSKKIATILETLKAIDSRVDPLKIKINTFATWVKKFKETVMEEFKKMLFQQKNIAKAAQFLRDAVIIVVEKQKVAWNEIMEEVPYIIDLFKKITPDIGTLFIDFNNVLQHIIGSSLVNPDFINKLLPITNTRIPNIDQALKAIAQGSKNYAE